MIKRYIVYGVLALLAMGSITIAVVPSLRSKAKAFFSSDDRILLAKASGRLTLSGPDITALKVQQADGLFVEVYKVEAGGDTLELMEKLRLPERRDAYFTFQGNATNLALGDLNSDGTLEILAPTFDENMVARLNIFKFNPELNTFERMNSDSN